MAVTTSDKKDKKTTKSAPKKAQPKGLSVNVVDMSGKNVGTTALANELFKVSASDRLLSQYVRVYLANQRQGTNTVKTRGEVKASTRKIYRQKGTGRARHGAPTANLFVGGGVTFGPQLRSFNLRMNKKQKQKALLYALSKKAAEESIIVVEGISKLKGRTKEMTDMFKALALEPQKTLLVYSADQAENLSKSMKNVQKSKATQARLMNAYDVLNCEKVLFTKEALKDFTELRTK